MSLDIGEVAALFHIHKAAHEHGESFKHIRDAAFSRLKEINEEHASKKEEPLVEEPQTEPQPEDPPQDDGSQDGRRV